LLLLVSLPTETFGCIVVASYHPKSSSKNNHLLTYKNTKHMTLFLPWVTIITLKHKHRLSVDFLFHFPLSWNGICNGRTVTMICGMQQTRESEYVFNRQNVCASVLHLFICQYGVSPGTISHSMLCHLETKVFSYF
jgi:hypothetical protein